MNHPFYSRESHVRGGQTNEFEDRGNSSRWSTPSAALGWYEKERRNYYHKSSRKRVLLYAHCNCGRTDQFPIAKYPNRLRSPWEEMRSNCILTILEKCTFYFVLPFLPQCVQGNLHFPLQNHHHRWSLANSQKKARSLLQPLPFFIAGHSLPLQWMVLGIIKTKVVLFSFTSGPLLKSFHCLLQQKGQNTKTPNRELWFCFQSFFVINAKKGAFSTTLVVIESEPPSCSCVSLNSSYPSTFLENHHSSGCINQFPFFSFYFRLTHPKWSSILDHFSPWFFPHPVVVKLN